MNYSLPNESEFSTDLGDYVEVPVRRLGTHYILGYGYIDREEFLQYVRDLDPEDFDVSVLDPDDVEYGYASHVDFDEDLPSITFMSAQPNPDDDAIPVTYVVCW